MNHPYPKSNSWFHFPVKCRSIVGLNMAVWGWTLFPAEWFCAFAESETAQFFFVVFFSLRIILPLIHITSTTGSERTMLMSLTEEWLCMSVPKKEKRKEKKSKTENKKSVFKRNIWRHCTIPRLISEIFKAKTFSKSTHKEHTKMSYYNCSLFFF